MNTVIENRYRELLLNTIRANMKQRLWCCRGMNHLGWKEEEWMWRLWWQQPHTWVRGQFYTYTHLYLEKQTQRLSHIMPAQHLPLFVLWRSAAMNVAWGIQGMAGCWGTVWGCWCWKSNTEPDTRQKCEKWEQMCLPTAKVLTPL